MIVLSLPPDDIALAGNPMPVILTSTDVDGAPFSWLGARTELKTTGYTDLGNLTILTLNWQEPDGPSLAANFQAVALPDADNEAHLPATDSGYSSNQAYWNAVAEKIQMHPDVHPLFRIYATDNGDSMSLWAVSRFYETGWTVEWNDLGAGWTTTPYDDLVTTLPDSYRTRLDIFLEASYDSMEYARIATLQGVPDVASMTRFDIASILHDAGQSTRAVLPIPAWDQADIHRADLLRRYYLRAYETTEQADPDYTNFLRTDVQQVLLAGISQSLFARSAWLAGRDATNCLLTWLPDGRVIDTIQPEWLAWYNWRDTDTALVVRLVEYDEAGASTTNYRYDADPEDRIEAAPGQVLLVPISATTLAIAADTVRFTVRLVDAESDWEGGNPTFVSPLRTYYVDREYYESTRYLMYLNGFNCPEVLRCTGDVEKDLSVDAETSTAILPIGFDETFPERRQTRAEWEDVFTYHSGYLPAGAADAVAHEVNAYGRLWEISAAGYIPLLRRGKSFPITATRQNLHAVRIEATPALLERYFSNATPAAGTAETDNAWLTDNLDYWATPLALPWQTP